jgi:multicomponent K+:H+ antiporter subunit E
MPGPREGAVVRWAWSLVLALLWLSLNGSTSAGHVVLALLFGFGIPWLLRRLWPAPAPRFRQPLRALWKSLAFGALVAWDVVVANLQVARAVLSPVRRLRPGFATVPIDLDDPRAIAVLAHTITLTPGTLTVDVAEDRRSLTIHALDLPDPDAAVRGIRDRYERRIREIFAC